MKILIHIGAHKTGTSSIQFFMHRNYERLLDLGILYPRSGIRRYGHHALALSCKANERRSERTGLGRDGELEMIMREIESSAADRCVLSSEAFFVTDPRNIARVASAMKELDVRILAFVRRPDTMFMSIYTSRLKKMKNPQKQRNTDYRRYLEAPDQLSKDLAYEEQIDNWASVFGRDKIDLRRVETGDSVDAMIEAIGIDPAGSLAAELKEGMPLRRNKARPNEELGILKLAKENIADAEILQRVWSYCREAVSHRSAGCALPEKATVKPFLSPSERRQIVKYFEESNDRLFASFGYTSNPYSVESLAITDDIEFSPLDNLPYAQELIDEALRKVANTPGR